MASHLLDQVSQEQVWKGLGHFHMPQSSPATPEAMPGAVLMIMTVAVSLGSELRLRELQEKIFLRNILTGLHAL